MKIPLSILIGLLLFNLLTISCSHPKTQISVFDSFPYEKNLKAQELEWNECNYPFHLQIYDSILAVVDMQNEYFFYFFNLRNNTFLGSSVRKGKGAGELVETPWLLQFCKSDTSDIYFNFVDQTKRERNTMKLLASIRSRKTEYLQTKKMSPLLPNQISIPLNDSIVVGTENSGIDNSLYLFSEKTETILKRQRRTKVPYNLDDKALEGLTQEWLQVKPDKTRIIGTFFFLKQFHIYDGLGNLLFVVKDKNPGELNGNSFRDISCGVIYYCKSILSDKYIYIVNQIEKNLPSKDDNPTSEILVFDYGGKPIVKYLLDRPIGTRSTIDFECNKLYAYDLNNFVFVCYDLGNL